MTVKSSCGLGGISPASAMLVGDFPIAGLVLALRIHGVSAPPARFHYPDLPGE